MDNETPRTNFGIGGVGSLKGSFVGTDNGILPDPQRAPAENDHLMEQVAAVFVHDENLRVVESTSAGPYVA